MRFDSSRIIKIIKGHVENNLKEYLIFVLILLVGVFLGVFFVNNLDEIKSQEIDKFIHEGFEKLGNVESIDNFSLLKTSIINNTKIGVVLWLFGTTVIGLPIVFGIVFYKGFSLRFYNIIFFKSIWNDQRNYFCDFFTINTKYLIYISIFSNRSKWHKTI